MMNNQEQRAKTFIAGAGRETGIILIILLAAYAIRVIYPALFMTGGDFPGHVLASMRLHQTSFTALHPLLNNFFAQILEFNHGYTTILVPWLLYEAAFNIIGLTITEVNLLYIHSIFGMLSLLSIYYFIRLNLGSRVAVLSVLIMAFLPAHIGLSRAHAGLQIMYLTFFYLSLAFLHNYLKTRKTTWCISYCIAAFFYIGCDNAFPVGLLLHLLYAYAVLSPSSLMEFLDEIRRIYLNRYSAAFILIPILVYLAVTTASLFIGLPNGYLLRLSGKTSSISFHPFDVALWLLELIGPAAVAFLCIIPFLLRRTLSASPDRNILRFLSAAFLLYFLLFSLTSGMLERNYVLFLAVPLVALTADQLKKRPFIVVLLIVPLTVLYSSAVVFRVNIGLNATENFGSLDYRRKDNDLGIKALGYLVRSNAFPVPRGEKDRDPIALVLDYEGAPYYLGSLIPDPLTRPQAPHQIFAYRPGVDSLRNREIQEAIDSLKLLHTASICRQGQVLVELYSDTGEVTGSSSSCYDVSLLNEKFNREFGTLDKLPRPWLGHF